VEIRPKANAVISSGYAFRVQDQARLQGAGTAQPGKIQSSSPLFHNFHNLPTTTRKEY
jgi:hypothetical protein